MTLTLQQIEAHLLGAANILRGKRLCDQWECEADDAFAEQERQQGRAFSETEKAVFRMAAGVACSQDLAANRRCQSKDST